jgi:Flp pilus assembly protein TadG
MRRLLRNNRGASAIEFALVALPVIVFMLGIIQTGWVVWANNLLHMAVDAASRCGAVQSTTTPCAGGSTSNMITTANLVFSPLSGASFSANACAGTGLMGTYTVSIVFVVNLTLTAKSCYPTAS